MLGGDTGRPPKLRFFEIVEKRDWDRRRSNFLERFRNISILGVILGGSLGAPRLIQGGVDSEKYEFFLSVFESFESGLEGTPGGSKNLDFSKLEKK